MMRPAEGEWSIEEERHLAEGLLSLYLRPMPVPYIFLISVVNTHNNQRLPEQPYNIVCNDLSLPNQSRSQLLDRKTIHA